MKLIDEKIKALGLTKGQYCEKYGYKFKDFAAKVHTLEAKIEWANKFLEPLGLTVGMLPMKYEAEVKPDWCRFSRPCEDQFCRAEKFSSCGLDERGEFDDEPNADSLL